MKKLISIVLALILSPTVHAVESEQRALNSLYDEIWHHKMISSPTYATYVGYPGQNGRWPDPSLEAVQQDKQTRRDFLKQLRAIESDQLDEDSLLGWQLVEKNLSDEIDGYAFPEEFILIHQRSGVQQDISDTLSMMPSANRQDFSDRISRLRGAADYIDKNIVVLREGLKRNITPPQITLRDVPEQIRNTTPEDILKSPLLKSFTKFPLGISDAEQREITSEAVAIVKNSIYPAFERLLTFLETDYIPNANSSIALSDMSNGSNWYRHRAKRFTTSNLTPKQIHCPRTARGKAHTQTDGQGHCRIWIRGQF